MKEKEEVWVEVKQVEVTMKAHMMVMKKRKLNIEQQQKLNNPNYFRNGNLQRVRSWYRTRHVILLIGKMK